MGKLQSWRSALTKAANLSGYNYSSKFQDESKLINEIVKDVLNKLEDDVTPSDSPRLVGLEGNLTHVESMLEFESQEVRAIGIWGMGGIGKTTLAQAVCDKFSFKFESCCFMENVREEPKKINGLSYLLQKLYCQLLDLDEENLNMYDAQTKRSIRRMLSRKKVLIVLDDVDTYEQLEYLVGENIYLGRGSRVIITSRDRHVLRGVHAMHEIGELKFEESLELFSLYAFNERNPEVGFEEISESAVSYAKGIPLALKVLGSHLHSRNKEEWEDALTKLQKHPHMQIQHVLRMSYDGLDELEKDIFLHIALFLKGHPKNYAVELLEACGIHASSVINQLQDKSLITVSDDNKIKVHDLLQEMGKQIVRDESNKHPERRSRLNNIDDIYDVLSKNNGTHEIEGIVFDVSRIENLCLSKDTFKKRPNLRFLKMYCERERSNVNVSFGISFPDELRYPELCRFAFLTEISLIGCKQVNKMVLQTVFDTSRCLKHLNMIEAPLMISNISSLSEHDCTSQISNSNTSEHDDIDNDDNDHKPHEMQTQPHFPRLQSMPLNSCKKLRSITELPPSQGETWDLDLQFKESMNLDEGIAMQFSSSKLLQAIYSNSTDYEHIFCYPTATIPSWFTYKETAGCPFIVELAPPSHSDQLLGFVVCGIVRQLAGSCRVCFDFFFEDGDRYWEGYSNREFGLLDSKRGLAFMWFVPYNLISPKTYEGRKFDEMGCYYICEASEEAVEGAACGVCPVYASQLDNIVAQILESNTSDHDDNDENHQPDEIQTQPHFQINLSRINPTSFDKQNERKGLQLFL